MKHAKVLIAFVGLQLTFTAVQAQVPPVNTRATTTRDFVIQLNDSALYSDLQAGSSNLRVMLNEFRLLQQPTAQQGQLMLRFQLIEATTRNQPRDPAIAAVDSVLRDLFRYGGYRLISEAAVAGNLEGVGRSTQILSGNGETFQLDVGIQAPARGAAGRGVSMGGRGADAVIATAQPFTIGMQVTLRTVAAFTEQSPPSGQQGTVSGDGSAQTGARGSAAGSQGRGPSLPSRTVLETTVTISPGHTVVLGSTQPGGPDRALILVMRPEIRRY